MAHYLFMFTRMINRWTYKRLSPLATNQFSKLLLTLEYKTQQLRYSCQYHNTKKIQSIKWSFITSYIDVFELLFRSFSKSSENNLSIVVDTFDSLNKIQTMITHLNFEYCKFYTVKSNDIHLQINYKTTLFREFMFIHYCLESVKIKDFIKYNQSYKKNIST